MAPAHSPSHRHDHASTPALDDRDERGPLDRDRTHGLEGLEVAVLIPCRDEETTIGKVVREFRAALPKAVVYVYDNNSTDRTAEVARAAVPRTGMTARDGR